MLNLIINFNRGPVDSILYFVSIVFEQTHWNTATKINRLSTHTNHFGLVQNHIILI